MSREYYLMNKNRILMLFEIFFNDSYQIYSCRELESYVEKEELPPGFSDIKSWVFDRNYAKYKGYLKNRLTEWKLDNIQSFIDTTHALSLNDTLWVKPVASGLTWENINLYENDFEDAVSIIAFEKESHDLRLPVVSPEFTAEGSFPKCWIREEDGIYIYKKSSAGRETGGKESYSEFYASRYSSRICRSSVDYDLVEYKGEVVSKCRMFTSVKEGFVPMYKYLDPKKYFDIEELAGFLRPYGFEEDFFDMLVLDAVILNPDRHFGNFGFIVDNDTFEIKRFAPVFDHNRSMLAGAGSSDLSPDSSYIGNLRHMTGNEFIPVANRVATERVKTVLRELLDEPLILHEKYNLEKERTDFLEFAVKRQIRGVLI